MNYNEIARLIMDKRFFAGVRSLCDDETAVVGDECRESYEWDTEEDCSTYYTTGELAGGTCATAIDVSSHDVRELAAEIERVVAEVRDMGYEGVLTVIGGSRVNNDGMFDAGEIRIVDATVLAVIA